MIDKRRDGSWQLQTVGLLIEVCVIIYVSTIEVIHQICPLKWFLSSKVATEGGNLKDMRSFIGSVLAALSETLSHPSDRLVSETNIFSFYTISPLFPDSQESTMPGKTLVVLGSGPGVGSAVAKAFSVIQITMTLHMSPRHV